MKKSIKFLSLILAVVMLVSIIPFSASALTAEIGSIYFGYVFDNGDKIGISKGNFESTTSQYFTLEEVVWEDASSGQPLSVNYTANNSIDPKGYNLYVKLKANANCEFSDSVSMNVNGVSLAKKSGSISENEFKLTNTIGGDHFLEFKVTFRYLGVATDQPYNSQLDDMVEYNSGFYNKGYKLDLYAYDANRDYHFEKWQVMQGSAEIEDTYYYDTVLTMPDTANNYVYAYYKPHDFDTKYCHPMANALGYTLHTCACDYEYKDNFVAPTGKPQGVKCAARTAAAEKISWKLTPYVSGYQVQISNAAGNKWATYKNVASYVNSYVFQKLAAGSNYKFRVRFFIDGPDSVRYYGGWTVIASPTLPKGTKLASVSAARKAFTAKWSKTAGVTGYQIQYSTNAKFTKPAIKTVKGASKYSYKVSKLKGGTRYYVRVRTYKTIGGKNYFSTWSGAKSVKTKK